MAPMAATCFRLGAGFDGNGRLGRGSQGNSSTPVEVAGGHTFQSIACGGSHTCAIDDEGRAWCWGEHSDSVERLCHTNHDVKQAHLNAPLLCDAGANKFGQLGTGNNVSSNVPIEAAAGRTFTALCGGSGNTCGLDPSGRALCWGAVGIYSLVPAEPVALQSGCLCKPHSLPACR